jgi:hypothetical protein
MKSDAMFNIISRLCNKILTLTNLWNRNSCFFLIRLIKSHDPYKSHHITVLTIVKSHATFLINELSNPITLLDLDRDEVDRDNLRQQHRRRRRWSCWHRVRIVLPCCLRYRDLIKIIWFGILELILRI